jgi:quercetin dioxygenase-like cupin family protein
MPLLSQANSSLAKERRGEGEGTAIPMISSRFKRSAFRCSDGRPQRLWQQSAATIHDEISHPLHPNQRKIPMIKKNLKLTLAGIFAACAFGGIALKFAWATPGQDIFFTPLSGPAVLGEIKTKSKFDDHEVELKTEGLSDVFVTHIRIKPGGHSGWHSHPGPSIISVTEGTLTLYDDCDDFQVGHHYPAGMALVEDAECMHMVVNQGNTDLEFIVVQIIPLGAPRLISEPEPQPKL